MLEAKIRPIFQRLCVDPVVLAIYYVFHGSANWLTLISGVVGMAILPALYFGQAILACCLLAISGYFDILDGSFARFAKTSSSKGAVLDII